MIVPQRTLQCVADANVTCASAGYNADAFVKLHNGIDTITKNDSGGDYWGGAFSQVDFGFSYDHRMNIGPNRAILRYIEEVEFTDGSNYGFPPSTEFPWSYSFVQHEDALVSVDDDCRITSWDQYGDDVEQNHHYDASGVVFGILCSAGIYPPFVCEMYGGIAATEAGVCASGSIVAKFTHRTGDDSS